MVFESHIAIIYSVGADTQAYLIPESLTLNAMFSSSSIRVSLGLKLNKSTNTVNILSVCQFSVLIICSFNFPFYFLKGNPCSLPPQI